jgi:uncharacterized protein YkwD
MRWLCCILLAFSIGSKTGLAQEALPPDSYSRLVGHTIDPENINTQVLNQAILRETNKIRRSFDLDTLLPDGHLDSAASIHAHYLSTNKKLVHVNSQNNSLKTPGKRISSTGVEMSAVAENLARMSIYRLGKNGRFFVDENGDAIDENGNPLTTLTYLEMAEKLSQGWLNSEGHRENLLGPYTHVGLAERKMRIGNEILTELVFVQNFGKY